MAREKKVKEKELLEQIKDSGGFISTIAARLHVDWHTVDNAIKASEKAQQAISDEKESTLDFVEGKALERIKANDSIMIRFYLQTKGKQRGYSLEKEYDTTVAAAEDTSININVTGGEPEPAAIDTQAGE